MLRFTTGANDNKAGKVWTLDPATGAPVLIGDTFKHEKKDNPDGDVDYGFLNTPESCLEQLPKFIPASYPGSKESHPYATAIADGVTYVADAGANAVFAISATGVVSTVALIPPAKVKITSTRARRRTACRTAPSARSTPSRACPPTSRSARTASST